MDLDKLVKLLAQTDGRDKMLKTVQGAAKVLAFYAGTKAETKKWDNLSKSIGEGRSIMRFGKFTSNIQKIQVILAKAGGGSGLTQKQIIEILRILGDFGYVVGDNLTYFSKYKMLPLDPKVTAANAKLAQFWGFICALLLDVLAIVSLDTTKPSYAADRQSATLTLVKDTADTLAVWASVGYLSSVYHPNAAFTGACTALSGSIATYTNWKKIK
jgi:hypothetical protein